MERKINRELHCCNGSHIYYAWKDLTVEERERNLILTNAAFEWCRKNPGKLLSFKTLNRSGLFHIYRFKIDDYNAVHSLSQIVCTTDGIYMEQK